MYDLLRESTFGRLVHFASGGKLFQYDEQLDPSIIDEHVCRSSKYSSPSVSPDSRPIEFEKGLDFQLVEFANGDPGNPRNWSTAKKCFITFQICLLTTSVYIGYVKGDEELRPPGHR